MYIYDEGFSSEINCRTYSFREYDESLSVFYNDAKGEHDMLSITYKNGSNSSKTITYVISKINIHK